MTCIATLTAVRETPQCRQNPSKTESYSDDDCVDEYSTEEGQNALRVQSSEKQVDEQDDFRSQDSFAGDTSQPHAEKPIEKKFKAYWLAGLIACFAATLVICGTYFLQSFSEIACRILGSSAESDAATTYMLHCLPDSAIHVVVKSAIGAAVVVGIICYLAHKYKKGELGSKSILGSLVLIMMLFAGLLLMLAALFAPLYNGCLPFRCIISFVVSLGIMLAASLLFLHALAHAKNSDDIHTYFFEMLAITALLFGCLN